MDPETGLQKLDELEDQRDFDPTEVEKHVTSPDSNRKILTEVRAYADEHEKKYGRFPKTLIFAANDLPHTSYATPALESLLGRPVTSRGLSTMQRLAERLLR